MKIRYYAPHPSKHEEILALLETIEEKWAIPHETVDLTGKSNIPLEEKEQKYYKQDFIPQASHLKQKTGSGIRKVLRSKSGGHYHLAGTIALVKSDTVEYFVNPFDPRKEEMLEFDEDIRIGFLKLISDHGKQVLKKFIEEPALEKTEEKRLIERFISSGKLEGKLKKEVRVGKRRMKYASEKAHSKDLFVEGIESGEESYYYRRVDVVCETDGKVWILEAKKELNNQVIGQTLVSDFLYQEDYPQKETKMGIICEDGNEVLEEVCERYGIKVFKEEKASF